MTRIWVVLAVIAVAFMIYSIVDCAMADRARIRGPRKGIWLLIIVLLPVIGGLLWFIIGRGPVPRGTRPTRPVAPDDDPAFLDRLRREAEQEERIRRLEQELADLDSDSDGDEKGKDGKDGTDSAGRRDG